MGKSFILPKGVCGAQSAKQEYVLVEVCAFQFALHPAGFTIKSDQYESSATYYLGREIASQDLFLLLNFLMTLCL